jgi:hypothetical protein
LTCSTSNGDFDSFRHDDLLFCIKDISNLIDDGQ